MVQQWNNITTVSYQLHASKVRAYHLHCYNHSHHCKSQIQSQMIWTAGRSLQNKACRTQIACQCQLTLYLMSLCTPSLVASWFCMWFDSHLTTAWWPHLLRRQTEEDPLLWFEEDQQVFLSANGLFSLFSLSLMWNTTVPRENLRKADWNKLAKLKEVWPFALCWRRCV